MATDESLQSRAEAAFKVIDGAMPHLSFGQHSEMTGAIRELSSLGPAAIPLVVAKTEEWMKEGWREYNVRFLAIVLGNIGKGSEAANAMLMRMLKYDSVYHLPIEALDSLAQTKYAPAIEPIVEMLCKNQPVWVERWARRRPYLPKMFNGYNNNTAYIDKHCVEALIAFGQAAVPALEAAFQRTTDRQTQMLLAYAFRKIQDPTAEIMFPARRRNPELQIADIMRQLEGVFGVGNVRFSPADRRAAEAQMTARAPTTPTAPADRKRPTPTRN